MMSDAVAAAVNRLADAQFQRASIEKKQLRVQEESLEVQKALLELQMVNLSVTRQLESALASGGLPSAGSGA